MASTFWITAGKFLLNTGGTFSYDDHCCCCPPCSDPTQVYTCTDGSCASCVAGVWTCADMSTPICTPACVGCRYCSNGHAPTCADGSSATCVSGAWVCGDSSSPSCCQCNCSTGSPLCFDGSVPKCADGSTPTCVAGKCHCADGSTPEIFSCTICATQHERYQITFDASVWTNGICSSCNAVFQSQTFIVTHGLFDGDCSYNYTIPPYAGCASGIIVSLTISSDGAGGLFFDVAVQGMASTYRYHRIASTNCTLAGVTAILLGGGGTLCTPPGIGATCTITSL